MVIKRLWAGVFAGLLLLSACGTEPVDTRLPDEGGDSSISEPSESIVSSQTEIEQESIPEPDPVPVEYRGQWNQESIFYAGYERAYQQLLTMTIEQKIGQLILARCPQSDAAAAVQQYSLGGFVLFQKDFDGKTAEQVTAEIQSYRQASPLPFIIAVDEEGGTVARVSPNPNLAPARFQSPQALFNQGGLALIEADAKQKAALLGGLGINLNLAPVADVSVNPSDYIYSRTYGKSAEETAEYVKTVVSAVQGSGVASALKHFPGYGNNRDTHMGISVDGRSLESFQTADFLPFQAGIDAGAECVLVSHNLVQCLDGDYPASLSAPVHQYLREQMGFTGIIMTDDLAMDAISRYSGETASAVRAIGAGNDLVITTDFAGTYQSLLDGVNSGALSEETMNQAVLRVLAWKLENEGGAI